MGEYARLVGQIDVAYQKALGPQYDALSIGCYAAFQGGTAATRRALTGKTTKLYWGDSVTAPSPEIRDFGEELELSLAGRLLNDEWLDQRKTEGYQGAAAAAHGVNTMFTWAALTHEVKKAHFDAVHRTFIENEANRRWLAEANPYALEEITRRLLEAATRDLWDAGEQQLDSLKGAVLELEGDLEERIGTVTGEMQGGSVDIKTRDQVETWKYEFTL
jgi:cobaltochelatase CobN